MAPPTLSTSTLSSLQLQNHTTRQLIATLLETVSAREQKRCCIPAPDGLVVNSVNLG